jgi:uncharacterized protein (UPF0147 family)
MMDEIHEELLDLQDDTAVPKNVRLKLCDIDKCLSNVNDLELNKVLDVLDEISNDVNLQSYVRSRIWSLTTMLESAKSSIQIVK